ncbi:zf-TFIIB domain-containing protein [Lysobacter sp. A3-1-A15]|uniref:TFIIB-type zinc ribbon-containing protein n=1 Tax=Novilysobacter viscosus TaxID=3098602 RepID=UPI002EDB1961
MKCPACDVALSMTDRQGIEIDYCPQCRGVWLDRGELDKIIERSSADLAPAAAAPAPPPVQHAPQHPQQPGYRGEREYQGEHKYRKKKSLLGDIFDF